MEIIKESIAIQRICPILQPRGQCTGSGCMAWQASRRTNTMVEVPWPEDLEKPRASAGPSSDDPMGMHIAPTDPHEFARWLKEKSEAALRVFVGTIHAETGRRILAASAMDVKLTKVRLTLEGESLGSCSLIR